MRLGLLRDGGRRRGDIARDVAVIDVGSNSVRLVLYRLEGRAIWTVYNEKVLAGLGREVAQTGRLSPAGVQTARAALRRFRAVLDAAKPDEVFTAATAAVRDSSDGPAFIEDVRRETGLDIRILSGREEAHASAMGVLAGAPNAEGVVGDLGGSSLELTRLADGKPGPGITLPLGPFALGAPKPLELDRVRKEVDRRLAAAAGRFTAPCFHAVGGAWRNLALLHMQLTDYPLHVVHQYELTGREAADAARVVARQSRGSLERLQGVSRRRLDTLPYSVLVLERLVEALKIERLVISAYGVREGLIFQAMDASTRGEDPLLAGCAGLAARHGVAERLGPALEAWLKPAFAALEPAFDRERDARLLAAACRLADVGALLHPDHRADLAFTQVLRAPIAGLSHPERAFLASSVFARYTSANPPTDRAVRRVLSAERLKRALGLGAAMRLGADLSGRSPDLLGAASLSVHRDRLVLTAPSDASEMLLSEHTRKRLAVAAGALDLQDEVRTG